MARLIHIILDLREHMGAPPKPKKLVATVAEISAFDSETLLGEMTAQPRFRTEAEERKAAIAALMAKLAPGIIAMHDANWPLREIMRKINGALRGINVTTPMVRDVLVQAGKLAALESSSAKSTAKKK
jgi:hypothetical protein